MIVIGTTAKNKSIRFKEMKLKACIFFVLIVIADNVIAQTNFEVRYLGNMGVAIIHNDSAILIDGLHDYYDKYYLPTDAATLSAILEKKKPFKTIVAIAFTHKHGDHFDSALVTNVSARHSNALLLGGNQTKSLLNSNIQKRFVAATDELKQQINSDILITLKKIPHVNPARHAAVENYRIEVIWNGIRFVHFGDADIQALATRDLKQLPDVLIIPDWFLSGSQYLNQLKAKKIIVSHIDPSAGKIKKPEKLESVLVPFMRYGDKLIIDK